MEKSTSPRNAKYLYKYVTKGPDRSMVSAELDNEDRPRDEIADYKDLRYVCKEYIYTIIFLFYRSVGSCEAMWHLRGYPISRRYPSVQVILAKHLLS